MSTSVWSALKQKGKTQQQRRVALWVCWIRCGRTSCVLWWLRFVSEGCCVPHDLDTRARGVYWVARSRGRSLRSPTPYRIYVSLFLIDSPKQNLALLIKFTVRVALGSEYCSCQCCAVTVLGYVQVLEKLIRIKGESSEYCVYRALRSLIVKPSINACVGSIPPRPVPVIVRLQ